MGNIYDNYQSIKIYNGNVFIADNINYQVIKLITNNTDTVSGRDYYPIELESGVPLSLTDIDISNETGNLYVGCLYNGYILQYRIIDGNIILQSNIVLKELLDKDIIISSIKYSLELNNVLVTTDSGLYMVAPDLSVISRVFDNFNNLNCLAYYNEYIYTFDQQTLIKYSNLHYLTLDNTYTFTGSNIVPFETCTLSNYNNPSKIINNDKSVYILDGNIISYFDINNTNEMYYLNNFNGTRSGNIIDMKVSSGNVYVLMDNSNIHITHLNGQYISNITNIDANIITLPDNYGNIYYISYDNKIKLYNNLTQNKEMVLENRGINIDEQSLYIYNNRVINAYQKNNSGITQLDENTYYSNENKLYNLNKNGITEYLGISNVNINGITNDTSNILMCTRNNLQIIDPFELTDIVSTTLKTGLNNPFKAISVDNKYFITDTFNHQIISINKTTQVSTVIVTGLNYPRGIDYNAGYLYVADSGLGRVLKINANSNVITDFTLNYNGVVDLTFSNNNLYLTSLLENEVQKVDANLTTSTYIYIEKPYYIDNEIDFLISKENAITSAVLSYADLTNLINISLTNINILISQNQLYAIQPAFKRWLDSQVSNAIAQKNLNTKYELLQQIEQSLNYMNGSMNYSDISTAGFETALHDFKINVGLIFQSIMKVFRIYGP